MSMWRSDVYPMAGKSREGGRARVGRRALVSEFAAIRAGCPAAWAGGRYCQCWRSGMLPFLPGLMVLEPAFQQTDRGGKLVVECDQQIDIIEIHLTAETVGQVVAWVDRGQDFAAAGAEEAEIALAHLGWRTRATEGGDGHGHWKIVAQATQQFRSYHEAPQGKDVA
jgi:hypothetical protein